MYWVGFAHLTLDSFIRDLRTRKISNHTLLFHSLLLINYWDQTLFLLFFAPFLTRWIGAGDLKLIAVIYLYGKALSLDLDFWFITAGILGLITALIIRKKSIPFAPALLVGALICGGFENLVRAVEVI